MTHIYYGCEGDAWQAMQDDMREEELSHEIGGRVYVVEIEKTVSRLVYVRAWNVEHIEDVPTHELHALWEVGDENWTSIDAIHPSFVGWEESQTMPPSRIHLDVTDMRYRRAIEERQRIEDEMAAEDAARWPFGDDA